MGASQLTRRTLLRTTATAALAAPFVRGAFAAANSYCKSVRTLSYISQAVFLTVFSFSRAVWRFACTIPSTSRTIARLAAGPLCRNETARAVSEDDGTAARPVRGRLV